jgi:hypothetical protein
MGGSSPDFNSGKQATLVQRAHTGYSFFTIFCSLAYQHLKIEVILTTPSYSNFSAVKKQINGRVPLPKKQVASCRMVHLSHKI